jgi:hypothetical protein
MLSGVTIEAQCLGANMRIRNQRAMLMLLSTMGVLSFMPPVSAREMERELLGAWATSASQCTQIFERQGGLWVYRRPIDEFAQAAIFEAGRILTPTLTCEVKDIARTKDVLSVTGMCKDSMSYTSQTARIMVKGKDEIVYSPTSDPALNTDFQRCSP